MLVPTGLSREEPTESQPLKAEGGSDPAPAETVCRHCAGPLLAATVRDASGSVFCCEGCREVHDLLGGKGWDQFYDLLKQSGGTAPRVQGSREYERFLDSLRQTGGLDGVGMRHGEWHTVQWTSSEVYCAACGYLVENVLREHPAIRSYEVDFIHGDLQFTYDSSKAHVADILALIARFGFRFKPREIETLQARPMERGLLMRMAVSGASFANAMAFALAQYMGLFAQSQDFWAKTFGWFSLLAALPAALYGGSGFLAGAYRALRAGAFSIDVTISLGLFFTLAVSLGAMLEARPDLSYADSLAGLVFFLLIGRWAVRRFESSLVLRSRWFEALKPAKVLKKTEAGFRPVSAEEVQPGDVLLLGEGTFAPVDGILRSPRALVELSVLTGESRPREIREGDALFAGARVEGGDIEISVTATPGKTRVAGLLNSLSRLQQNRSENTRLRERIAFAFTSVVVLCAVAALVYHGAVLHAGWRSAFLTASSIFTISCACALALALPISRGLGLKRAHALGFHFRSQEVFERLPGLRAALFDKTGTLSLSHRRLKAWTWAPHRAGRVKSPAAVRAETPSETQSQTQSQTQNQTQNQTQARDLLPSIVSLCRHSRHPVAVALAENLAAGITLPGEAGAKTWPQPRSIREVLHLGLFGEFESPDGRASLLLAVVKFGAWEEDAQRFSEMGLSLDAEDRAWLGAQWAEAPDGRRTLQTADKPNTALFRNGQLWALATLSEEIRPDVPDLIARLKKQGVHTVLVSGDDPERVQAFGKACGFDAIAGGLDPEGKQKLAASVRRDYGPCLAIGDGFNDSLLLGEATVSIAVAGDLPMVAEGADILFTGESPRALVDLLAIGEGVRRSLLASYTVSGLYNVLALAAAFMGWVSPLFAALLMPLSSLSLGLTAYFAIPRPRR